MIGQEYLHFVSSIIYIGGIFVWGLLVGILVERTRENNRRRNI